ncbi:hypothetical protein DBR43_04735 [Pedobacter sp. KBW06]|nr:hypothetical protein DBR43_04735 [Pedobacter sp. KBW06]
MPDIRETFYHSILRKIESYSRNKNYNVIFGQSFENPERERQILDNMTNLSVDGVLICSMINPARLLNSCFSF